MCPSYTIRYAAAGPSMPNHELQIPLVVPAAVPT
jgi:hypothetical protein